MFSLVADVGCDPGKVLAAETDNAVTRLPGQDVAVCDPMVDKVAAGSLQLPDPLTRQYRRGHRDDQVNVVVGAANFVEVGSGSCHYLASQEPVQLGFDLVAEYRIVVLDVPCEMKVYFAVGS